MINVTKWIMSDCGTYMTRSEVKECSNRRDVERFIARTSNLAKAFGEEVEWKVMKNRKKTKMRFRLRMTDGEDRITWISDVIKVD